MANTRRPGLRTALGGLVAAALALGALASAPTAASAIEPVPTTKAPFEQRNGDVATADPQPTVQIDSGYVWAQATIGNTVYAVGSFSNARAPQADPGTQLTPRANVLAYDITTGDLLPFAPQVNGVVKAVAASPDGSRIYIGGSFNQVNGQARWGLAALDARTGELVPGFSPAVGGTGVFGIAVTADSVYVAGSFTQANGVARKNLAAFASSNGALRSWAPTTDLQSDAIVVEPGGAHIVAAGRFGTVNGVTQRGLVALDPTTGGIDTGWLAPKTVKNGVSSGTSAGKAGIFTLATDDSAVYGTGWVYASADVGNLEGVFAANAGTGSVRWVSDCHGDHYGVYSTGKTVYATSHTHACETVNLWPEQNPRAYRYIEAYTTDARGTLTRSATAGSTYADWSGTPSPSAYAWYPDFTVGTASGLGQAGLSITGSGDYISVAGEFTSVNNQRFQGIVRFSTKPATGAKQGPRLSGSSWTATGATSGPGRTRVTVPLNWDRDDRDLTYELLREGVAEPVARKTVPSGWWMTGSVSLDDAGLTAGASYTYTVRAVDGDGNAVTSSSTTAAAGAGVSSPYADMVLNDGAELYYPLGNDTKDWAGTNPPLFGTGATSTSPGAVAGVTGERATKLSGTSSGRVSSTNARIADNDFSVELWFKTNTTRGGKLIGFGNSRTSSSSQYDRHVYMQNNGRLTFGVYPGSTATISSTASYNDNAWHHLVASQSAAGMALYVDGQLVAQNAAVTTGDVYSGYWRIGGDTLSSWPNAPSSAYFAGTVDEVAVYATALTASQVSTHRATGLAMTAPTAAFTPTAQDLGLSVDASASQPGDGSPITSYSWTWGDGTANGTGATATHTYAAPGEYTVTLTVTDQRGLTGTVSQKVVAKAPNVPPTASATVSATGLTVAADGTGSTDADGQIAGYDWDWGDGTAHGTGATATHAYAAPGDYTVTLTVTDDRGGVATKAVPVTVTHADPVASFALAAEALTVSADASGSSASDGATLGFAWDWGDGETSEGVTAQHAYAAPGAYTVTLTVTDSIGASATKTRDVTVEDRVFAVRDDFERSVPSGWGAAEVGGTYSAMYGSAANGSVSGGRGVLTLPAGQTRNMALASTPLTNAVIDVSYSLDQAPSTGGSYVGVAARQSANADYLTRVWQRSDGTLWLVIQRSGTILATKALGTPWAAGDVFRLRVEVSGTSPTTISAKTWKDGAAEPGSWQITATDSTAALQQAGWISLHASRGGAATTTGAFSFDGLRVVDTTPAPNQPPVAAMTATATGLTVAADGSGSTDPDGSIASFAWNWGDGSPDGSGASATHDYAVAGTYTVTLTVTDDKGATATAAQAVTVAAAEEPPGNQPPVAAFTATAAGLTATVDGSGSTDADGTVAAYAWDWGDGTPADAGATATHAYAAAGTYTVTLTVTDDKGATGTTTQEVTVSGDDPNPAGSPIASDDFGRTTPTGWGTADLGGAWSVLYGSAAAASVADGVGKVSLAPGDTRNLMLNGVSLHDVELTADIGSDAAPGTGSGYAGLVARASATDNYTVRLWLHNDASVWVVVQRGSTVLTAQRVPGLTRAAGDVFSLKVQVTGGASTTVSAKVWRAGTEEPAGWQATATDAAGLDAAGTVGVHTNRSGAATTPSLITVDNLRVTDLG